MYLRADTSVQVLSKINGCFSNSGYPQKTSKKKNGFHNSNDQFGLILGWVPLNNNNTETAISITRKKVSTMFHHMFNHHIFSK